MKRTIGISDFLFCIAFSLYYLSIFVTYTVIPFASQLKQILAILTVLLLIINLITGVDFVIKLRSKKGVLTLFLFVAITILSVMYRDYFIIVLILFCLNIKAKKFDAIVLLRISLFLLLIATILIVMLCVCGVLENRITFRTQMDMNNRYAFGFYHSNVLPNILLYWWIYYYAIHKKITVVNFTVAMISNVCVYLFCNSRNSLFSLSLMLMLFIGFEFSKRIKWSRAAKKVVALIGKYSFAFFSILSFGLLELYKQNNYLGVLMNNLFSYRLQMGALYFHFQKPKVLQLMTSDYFKVIRLTLDNGYFYSVARYGFIYLIMLSGLLYFGGKELERQGNDYALISFGIMALSNSVDNGFFSFQFYPFMLFSIYGGINCITNRKKASYAFFDIQKYIHRWN